MPLKKLLLLLALPCLAARAQGPLNPPVPLAPPPRAGALSPGTAGVSLASAQRAQELGLPTIAIAEYRKLIEVPGADRAGLTLALATTLLDAGDAAEAEKVLNAFMGLRGAAWQLRMGLAAAQLKKNEAAKTALAAAKLDDLGAADRAWWHFLSGLVADAANDVSRANDAYQKAEQTAPTELTRARFMLAHERAVLQRVPTPDPAQLQQVRTSYNNLRNTPIGYQFLRQYAVMLDAAKRRDEAVSLLQGGLLTLPASERGVADDFRLMLGMIAGMGRDPVGRTALTQLLETGSDADKQRIALQLLASAADGDAGRTAWRAELDKLTEGPAKHAIRESLLLYRAQLALTEKDYPRAEADATRLLNEFPGSQLRAWAFGVRTASAWEQRRYRTAADSAQKARTEFATAVRPEEIAARGRLGVLEAEARFRAGEAAGEAGASDYRAAADAYASALRDRPADVRAGDLMFQRVLAEIRAGTPEAAEPLLDEFARDPALQTPVDLESRWQAEWHLARALQVAGKTAPAFVRVTRLLAAAPAGATDLKPELRARMAWLQARLSLAAGQPEQTLKLVEAFAALPAGIDAALKKEIASTGALLKAEANFQLWEEARDKKRDPEARTRETAALDALKQVRADFTKTDAAGYSYIVEASHYALQEKAVEAQKLLTNLADEFPDNTYAPYALYEAAIQSERLGQDKNYRDATAIIERLVTRYPDSKLVFAARLKEGDLFRLLNDFPRAQLVYEELVNKYPQHGDVIYAKLALAQTLNAQSSNNDAHVADVQARFESLRDLADEQHIDVRVEAGYNLGALLARRGAAAKAPLEAKALEAKALEVWWNDVVHAFLDNAERAAKLGPTGRFWMARTLLEAGALYEKQEKLEEAQQAWRMVLGAKLGHGEATAKAKLERFKLPEAPP